MAVTITNQTDEIRARLGLPPEGKSWTPYQYEFNYFTFGAKTPFVVESVKNLLGQDASSRDFSADSSHGAVPGQMTLSPKRVEFTIKGHFNRGRDVEEAIAKLKAAFVLPRRNVNVWVGDFHSRDYFTDRSSFLIYYRPGWPEPRHLYCRVTKIQMDSDYAMATGNLTCNVQLTAPDPVSYGHYVYMVKCPSGESFVWNNRGDFPDGYAPRVVLSGAVRNPNMKIQFIDWLTLLTREVEYKVRTNSGIDLDMRNGIALPRTIGATLSKAQFWTVPMGESEIFYSGGAGSMATFYIRDAWQ